MAPPSYARATTASTLRARPGPRKTEEPESSDTKPLKTTPKKLKRPSTLTPQHRQTLAYNASLYPIIPHDPTKPCPLANLPSELRAAIYTYALSYFISQTHFLVFNPGPTRYIWPQLLHICRAIRVEAAYTYYTTVPFTFTAHNLDFSHVQAWIGQLPSQHRALLAKNRRLTINVILGRKNTYICTDPPHEWLLDDTMHAHWKACAQFGNLYSIPSVSHKLHFILFARLASWFRFTCSASLDREITWHYDFGRSIPKNFWWQWNQSETLVDFLKNKVGVLGMECVGKAWTRGRKMSGREKQEGLRFLEDLNRNFEGAAGPRGADLEQKWVRKMESLRRAVENW